MYKFIANTGAIALIAAALLASSQAMSQEPLQTLDRVEVRAVNVVSGNNTVLEMQFEDAGRTEDFLETGIAGSDFRACKLTGIDGLFCLDGNVITNWSRPDDPLTRRAIIDCEDPALKLDTKKDEICTALTVDLGGTIWFSGKDKKGPTFVLYKAVKKPEPDLSLPGECDADFFELTPPPKETADTEVDVYCAKLIDKDKPLIVDLNSIDGDVAVAFPLNDGKGGVSYLEQRKTGVFQPADGSMRTVIASGKRDWGLLGGENEIQSIALWQSPNGEENWILVATEFGRILALEVLSDGSFGPSGEAFDIVFGRTDRQMYDPVANCDLGDDAAFAIRTSSKSGLVYVTDRQCREVLALKRDESAPAFKLTNEQELAFEEDGDPICEPPASPGSPAEPCHVQATADLTLSTAAATTALVVANTFAPEAPTVAPGISQDLRDCGIRCDLLFDAGGDPAYFLTGVVLEEDVPSGLTLFQIKNIPDCRYIPDICVGLGLNLSEVIVDPGMTKEPEAQLLNLSKLLPQEILDLFPEGLPDTYLPQQYRGQRLKPGAPFTFEAFFGRTEEGVIFRDTFTSVYNVGALAGAQLGCHTGLPDGSPLVTDDPAVAPFGTLEFDIAGTVSERYISPTDPALIATAEDPLPDGGQRVASMTNDGCGSTRSREIGWSLKPYNLEITPCTFNRDPADVWVGQGTCPVLGSLEEEVGDDAVLAKLLLVLFDELGRTIDELACIDADGNGDSPLTIAACATAQADWTNTKDKLDKCWDASQQPKQSSGNQNCQAFISQATGMQAFFDGLSPNGLDKANRIGELAARLQIALFVYQERVVPSLDADGFCEPDNPDCP